MGVRADFYREKSVGCFTPKEGE